MGDRICFFGQYTGGFSERHPKNVADQDKKQQTPKDMFHHNYGKTGFTI
jgi:hypothetical protein